MTLERNYRSTQPVLDAANALAAQATRAFPKRLRADREGGVRPRVVHVRDEAAQAEEVCDRILEAREQGSELRAQAVLARTSHDSDLLELELTRRRVPFHKYGGLRYLEAAHVKDFVATLRLVDNGADDVAWFRVLQLVEGVGPVSARRAIAAMAQGDAGGRRRRTPRATARPRGASPRPARGVAAARGSRSPPRRATSADALIAALLAARARAAARAARRERCATCSRRWSGRATPTARCGVQDLDQLVAAAHQATRPAPLRRRARPRPAAARAPTSPSRRTWTRTT